jgi:hypothetical protein
MAGDGKMKDITRNLESVMVKGFIIRNNIVLGDQEARGDSPEGHRIKIE